MSEKSCAKMLFTAARQKGRGGGGAESGVWSVWRGDALKRCRKVCNTLGFAVAR